MNILVVGGGIGGLASTIALSRAGHEVTLAERTSVTLALPQAGQFEPVGAGIILAPNAVRALQSLGVNVAARGFALPSTDLVSADGRLLRRIELQDARYGPTWSLTRPALHEALVEAIPSSVNVCFGRPVAALQMHDTGVDVAGTGERFDLVVGADGLRSQIRESIFGLGHYRYGGTTCWRGLARNPGFTSAIEGWGGVARIGMVPLPDGQLYYYLVLIAPPHAPPLTWPDGFKAAFGAFRGELARIFDVLDEAPPLHHDIDELDSPIWGKGRVLLLGDAAHGMTPNQGQGAAMAIEDALALTVVLRDGAAGVDGALERYRALRHKRVRRVQLDSRRVGNIAHWQNPIARWFRDGMLRVLPNSFGRAQYRAVVDPGLALLTL